jgi:hypothetical protein
MISAIRNADGTYGPWGNPVCLTGDKGDTGTNGYTVTLNPSSVIITQKSDKTFDVTDAQPIYVAPSVMQPGSSEELVVGITVKSNYCLDSDRTPIVSASPYKGALLKITGVNATASQNLYTKGYVVLTVEISSGETFDVTLPIAVIYLGTYSEKIFDDHKDTFAQQIITSINDSGTFVANDSTYQGHVSALGELRQWKNNKETQYDGYSQRITDLNTQVNTAKESVSALRTEVDGVVTDMSEVKQTSKSVNISVQNLLGYRQLLKDATFAQAHAGEWNDWQRYSQVVESVSGGVYSMRNSSVDSNLTILEQNVGDVIANSEYYTFSFQAKHAGTYSGSARQATSTQWQDVSTFGLFLVAGVTYRVKITARSANSSYPIRVRLRYNDRNMSSETLVPYSTSYQEVDLGEFTPQLTGEYKLQARKTSASYTGYISGYSSDKAVVVLNIDELYNGDDVMIDGRSVQADSGYLYIVVSSRSSFESHYVTFRTDSDVAGGSALIYLSATLGHLVTVYRPRLEIGASAHAFADNKDGNLKRTGIDIEQGKITAVTNNFEIMNQSGDTTFSIDTSGNIVGSGNAAFAGTIAAKAYNFKVYFAAERTSYDFDTIPDDADYYVWKDRVGSVTLPAPGNVPGKMITVTNPYDRNSASDFTVGVNSGQIYNLNGYPFSGDVPLGKALKAVFWSDPIAGWRLLETTYKQ